MTKNELYSKLFGFNASTYHRWKNEERPIIKLLQKYCDQNELEEFLKTGKISRLEKNNTNITDEDLMLFFADNAIFKIIETLKEFSLDELIENENLKNIDLIPEEAAEIDAMVLIYDWIDKSQTVDDFLEIVKKHNYTFLTILLNPLEIAGMIEDKQYTIEKIKTILDEEKTKEIEAATKNGQYFDDETKDDTYDEYEDYDWKKNYE